MIELLDAALDGEAPERVLSRFAWLGDAIDADARFGRFAAWGRSTVVDENVGAPVLSPAAFEALHACARIGASWPVGNAGLLHVYGYLLSTTSTPYGLKRDRWLGGDLARACGLPRDAFTPWTGRGTLLERVGAALLGLFDTAEVRRVRVEGVDTTIALRSADGGGGAVGYAVDGALVTMFPVADLGAVRTQLDVEPPRLRWNAAL